MRESNGGSQPSLSRAIALARDALSAEPAGLLTDFDGTISPIVADPSLARPAEGAPQALEELAARLAVVAIITGRAPLDARRMTGVDGLLVVGNHGTEWLEPDAEEPDAPPAAERVRAALAELLRHARAVPDANVEDKGLSATVHYRRAADPAAARAAILAAIGALPDSVVMREGRMSIELRPAELGDKGSAARRVIERYGLRGAVVMGDDVTDLDMFRAIDELRRAGRLSAAVVAVGGADREVPTAVAEAADEVLPSPEQAAAFLTELGRQPPPAR